MKKAIFLFIIIFLFLFFFIPNVLAQTYTTKYLGTTAISGLGGTYWNLTDTTETEETLIQEFLSVTVGEQIMHW